MAAISSDNPRLLKTGSSKICAQYLGCAKDTEKISSTFESPYLPGTIGSEQYGLRDAINGCPALKDSFSLFT